MQHISIDLKDRKPAGRSQTTSAASPTAKHTVVEPDTDARSTNATLTFVGTATTILHFPPLTILTDPNFLHAGDHVHLGPGVNATRETNPSIDLKDLPNIDAVLLSHYHEDHFDREVEEELRRTLPIITTPHAKECLVDKKSEGEKFESVTPLNTWETVQLEAKGPNGKEANHIRVTSTPGKHVPPGALETANNLLGAVPPTSGWIVELFTTEEEQDCYRIYITGDTLLIDDLKEIPRRYSEAGKRIDLMLAHLGGTTIPSTSVPLLMVTMDAKMGIELVKMVNPDLTIPIHFDDYDVFASPLSDFKDEVKKAGLENKVVFLDRGDAYAFQVK